MDTLARETNMRENNMEKYNYYAEVANDIVCWMDDYYDPFDLSVFSDRSTAADWLYEHLWTEDEITGNGNDWYDSEEKCEEYICHNLDLALFACEEFCMDSMSLMKHWKNGELARCLDTTIRCFILMQAIYDALEEWEDISEQSYQQEDDERLWESI